MNRTGSKFKIILASLVVLGSACTSTGNLWQSGPEGNAKLANNSADSQSSVNTGSAGKQILFSDQASGLAVMQDAELASDKFSLKLSKSEPVMKVMKLTTPPRLVVDLIGVKGAQTREISVKGSDGVSNIRIGAHADKIRVVFDLKSKEALAGHSIDSVGQDVVLNVPVKEDTRIARVSSMGDSFSANAQANAQLGEAKKEEVVSSNAEDKSEKAETATNNTDTNVTAESEQLAETAKVETEVSEIAPKSTSKGPILSSINFEKSIGSAGEITANLTDQVAFELKQTSPSEYVIAMPGVKAEEMAKKPMIAAKGEDGIRSVRVTENKEGVLLRMFVDAGTVLSALPRGNDILIKAGKPSASSSARAQLESPDTKGMTKGDKDAQANPTGFRSADGSKIYTGRLISLDLQDTNIDSALRIIAEISNLNIIASDDVNGKVTLRLIDVPWDQALDVILKTNGLDQVAEGNVIRIAPVDKLRAERESLKESKRAAENLEDLTVQYVRVSYARAEDVRSKVEPVLSERGTVTADERTNQLIIKDIKQGQKSALELLKKLDLRTPQILLETQIVEGNRSMLRELGFNWNFSQVQSPQTGNATGLNFPNSVTVGASSLINANLPNATNAGNLISAVLDSADGSKSLGVKLAALESENKIKVVSRPQVATVNNKEAQIKSVEVVRVPITTGGNSIGVGAGASASGGGQQAFQSFNVGIELNVTPQASPDYFVLLDVKAKSSTFSTSPFAQSTAIPNTFERETTSTILVKSGQTFALGGVYRTEDKTGLIGLPYLKDIPVLGFLFRNLGVDSSDQELIFFITPHIVEGSFDAAAM